MKRKSIIIGAVIALSLTACQKELQGLQEPQDYAFAITATRESCADDAAVDTKATISNAKLSWSAGETINIYSGDAFVSAKTLSGGESATFYSDKAVSPSQYAVYPKLDAKLSSGNALTVTLPAAYENYKSGEAYPAMLATFENTPSSLYFKHLGGLVKFNVTGLPKDITKFVFATTNNMPITGEFTVTDDSSNKVIKSEATTGTTATTVTYSFENTAESNDMVFYLPLPVLASDAQYNFQIDFQTAAGASIYETPRNGYVKIERGKYFTFNIAFSGTSGGSESGTTNVTLDSSVKDYTLPSTDGTVNVKMATNSNNVTIGYATEGLKPANVNIICEGALSGALTVNLPDSHVTVKGTSDSTPITITSLDSSTSNTTLILENSVKITSALTVSKGSATIACEVPTVTVAEKEEGDTSEGEVTIKVAEGGNITTKLEVAQGNVEIAAGSVAEVEVKESVGSEATVTVASGAEVKGELKVAQAKSVEIAGTVPTVTVAATATSPVVTVAETANIATKLEVAKGSVDVAQNAKIDAVEVAATVSNVTIATAVKTVTVTAAAEETGATAAPVIWVTETGKVTEAVEDKTSSTSGTSSVTVVAANGQATENQEAQDGQVKVVKDNSGNTKTDVVKTPADYMADKIKTGGEITLEDNITGNFTIENGKEVTINLNGHKITNKDAQATFTVALGGKLTIKGEGTVDNTANRYPAIHNNGTLTLNGGTYTRSAEGNGNSYYTILNHGEMTVNSGVKVENSGTFSSTIGSGYDTWTPEGDKYTHTNGTNAENPSLTINGGTITGGKYNVKNGTNSSNAAATLNIGDGVELDKVKDNGVFVAYVASETTLNTALASTDINKIVLTKDIALTNFVTVNNSRTVKIDMNGKTLTTSADCAFNIYNAKVEFTGNGTINQSGTATVGLLRVRGSETDTKDYTVLSVGQGIKLVGTRGILLTNNADAKWANYGVVVNCSGTINSEDYALYVNGQNKLSSGNIPEFNIDGATLSDGATGIYAAGYAKWDIKNSTISGKETAIEIRAGEMTIESGTYTSNGTFSAKANGNGTTITGAALAISQHTTDLDINVKVNGGTFKGVYALYEDDLQNKTGNVTVTVANSGVTLDGKVYSKHFPALNTPEEVSTVDALKAALANEKVNKITFGDNITLADKLEISIDRAVVIDLNGKTLTGRTNLHKGNLTFKNGKIAGGKEQALNVYGSSNSSDTNYSVLTVEKDVTVTGDVWAVCIFGEENTTTTSKYTGYGAVINLAGTVSTTGNSKEGAVFVYGNLGKGADTNFATSNKNFINVTGSITSAKDAAIALNGSATVTVENGATINGNTAIAIKRGKLVVNGGTITGTGECVDSPTVNGNGTEMTGAAVSATATYSDGGPLSVDIKGGDFTSKLSSVILNNSDNEFTISGGTFKSEATKDDDSIAVWARLGSVTITGGTFENKSNGEATLYVGTSDAITKKKTPKLTISGANTVVKNTATGTYKWNSALAPLAVNMKNELTQFNYKPVDISGGTFYGNNPAQDDNVKSDYGKFLKSGYKSVQQGSDNVWKVVADTSVDTDDSTTE